MSEPAHDPQLNALEATLASLQPSPPTLDRDRLLFHAGRMSVKPGWVWPALAAISSLTAILLGLLMCFQPEPRVQFVYLPAPAPVSQPPTEVVQQPPSPVNPVMEVPKPWLRGWLPDRDRLLEQSQVMNAEPLPEAPPAQDSLRHVLGLSRQEWQQTYFLGKTPNPTEGGGF